MTIALIVIAAAASIFAATMSAVALFKAGHGGSPASLRRLEEKTDTVGSLCDYNSRAVENLSRSTEQRLSFLQKTLADDMKYIADVNAQNYERIRRTVDDKLSSSLDGKLSESYARISERLEKMYESVGEMKSLSENVSDIRRVFVNVKLRGAWGEAQLDAILSQMLSPEQYARNVRLNPLSDAAVDFAVRMPSHDGAAVFLPIDSKFPVEEFERLAAASEQGDKAGAERARKNLAAAVKTQADSIATKYLLPPVTTDFALMYLPSEGLYAEVARAEGLGDYLRARRVIACGPTNLGALLSLLQTGFRSAAIERRSGELREMLEGFRHDFEKFSEALDKTRKKLQEAQDAVDATEKRTSSIHRRLDSFRGELPPGDE